jgi:hypothetical protein
MKFFGVSKWKNTGDEFISTTFSCSTREEAETTAKRNEATYRDQTFLRVIQAENFNDASRMVRNG